MRAPSADPPGLLARLRAGDPEAFEALVRTHQHRVFGVALRMLGSRAEAEEIGQEVFVRAHQSIGGFRGEAALSTWLYAIASRLCLNRLASRARQGSREGEEVLVRLRDDHPDPPALLERRELERLLHRAISELPDDRRIVLVLRDLEGLAYEDIAEALELEIGTVKSRLHRARLELKERLEKVAG